MPQGAGPTAAAEAARLEIVLGRVEQLFNSFDPAPFHEKDLDPAAEAFLVSWAAELPRQHAMQLRLHLQSASGHAEPAQWVPDAIHHYFAERARYTRFELHQLLRKGRVSLASGLLFLVACLFAGEWIVSLRPASLWAGVLRESLTIGGWVAMWQPLQIYLHDWWPIRDRERLYLRMSRMPIEVVGAAPARPADAGAAVDMTHVNERSRAAL